ncbi:structural protein [uncultured Caudovirales phage]|uniref:Structural protein n=1 Tax=uncultured Caudovirales phage TaxID=2100421 RepID=A0A6J5L1J1_9CAUD|nr:structural protein [uncultured Caudovirales phage]
MGWRDCADRVRSAAGRELTDDQVADVFEAVDRHKQALVAAGQLDGLDARLRDLVAQDAERMRIEAALAKKHAALSIIARDRATRMIQRHIAAGLSPRKAVLALFEGTTRGVEGGRHSIAATKLAYEGRYVGGMMARIVREVPHAEGLLTDRAFLDDVVREMMERREGGNPGSTRNTDARKVAEVFADHAEMSRADLNRLGANIGKLDGWAGAQIHDGDKVGAVTKEAWVDAILPRLDMARTFEGAGSEAEVRHILGNVWENIVFGPDRGPGRSPTDTGFTGPRNVAKALERHRVLHFKTADDWIGYSQQFGHGHIFDGMVSHQSKAALNASQMELLGPNPGATLKAVLDALKRDIDRDASVPPAEKAEAKAKLTDDPQTSIGAAFRIANGAALIPVNKTVADIAGGIRAAQSLAKLGGATISSVSDFATAVVNLRFNGLTFGQAIRGQFSELMQGRGKGEQRELAYLLNEGFEGVIGRITSPYVAADGAPGAMQGAMATFFRWTGLTWWTDASRAGAARVLSAHLGRNAGLPFAELNPRMRNALSQHGIDAGMWDTIRTQGVRQIDGRAYVSPEGLAGNHEADLALRRYFSDETRTAVLEADPQAQRMTTLGLSRGTVAGEAMRFVMQFKGYPLAFTNRVLGRAWQGGEGGRNAGAAHIGGLFAGLTVLGYAAMTAKDLIRGYEPRELADENGDPRLKTILAAIIQGGGAGIYGDFLFGEASRSGNSALENLAGPVLSDAARWANLLAKARDGDAKAGDAVTAALGSTPFANVFYARPIFDYLAINSLREALSPGYLARQDQRRREQFGQNPLVAPSDRIAIDLF